MKTSKLVLYPLLATLLVALTSCSITSSPARFKETRTLTVAHVPGSALKVTTGNGAITVQAGDRDDVEIVADLRLTTAERLEAVKILAARDNSDRLSVAVGWPDGKKENNEGCSFTITVPDATGVDLRTANGQIKIAGLAGKAEIHTSNGRIEVKDQDGDAACRTSNGAISIEATGGDIDAHTSNGRIDIQEATRSVKARTSNGSARIRLAEEGMGPVEADSSNGSMTLELGNAFRGELELRNSNGSLDVNDLPNASILSAGKHHMRLKFGESENQSKITTSNGAIHVRRR